ncbi:hypothetical protein [Krasilnikovia sp. M28-CT-15]|uniref:hypothetical protein n=1 Tax=Krasilnikovia sp. M28-CT-15 TaxID=3373540 RepID=UPI003876D38E
MKAAESRLARLDRWAVTKSNVGLVGRGLGLGALGLIAVLFNFWGAYPQRNAGPPWSAAYPVVTYLPFACAVTGVLIGWTRGRGVGRGGGLPIFLAGAMLAAGALIATLLWYGVLLVVAMLWAASDL